MVKMMGFLLLISTLTLAKEDIEKVDLSRTTKLRMGNTYSEYLNDKPVKIKFVATWCKFCLDEFKKEFIKNDINKYIYIFGDYGIDNRASVDKFLKSYEYLEDVLFDEEKELLRKFEIKKVPAVVEIKR